MFQLDIPNLFDTKASQIDDYDGSHLHGEPAGGIKDFHFLPVEPLSFRVTLAAQF